MFKSKESKRSCGSRVNWNEKKQHSERVILGVFTRIPDVSHTVLYIALAYKHLHTK